MLAREVSVKLCLSGRYQEAVSKLSSPVADRKMTRNIAVTGGAGFIGRHLVARLARHEENKIWVFDNLHPQVHGPSAIPPRFPPSVTFINGDITRNDALHELLSSSQPELIYHLAAETGTSQSMDEVARYCEINVTGTARLLEAVRKTVGALRRFVLASSRAVYGEGQYRDLSNRRIVPPSRTLHSVASGNFEPVGINGEELRPMATSEDACAVPCSIYASTKLMQELLVCQATPGGGKATILRLQNVYGPGQSLRNPYTGVLSIFAHQLLGGKKLEIYEDGRITRDFIFVEDAARALELAGSVDLSHGTTINIGSGKPTTIREAAVELMKLFGKPTNSYKITGHFREGDVRYAVADTTLAAKLLGWAPEIGLDRGLDKLARWCEQEASYNLQ